MHSTSAFRQWSPIIGWLCAALLESLLCIAAGITAAGLTERGFTDLSLYLVWPLVLSVPFAGAWGPLALAWAVVRRLSWWLFRRSSGRNPGRSVEALTVMLLLVCFTRSVPGSGYAYRHLVPAAVYLSAVWWCAALLADAIGRRVRAD